MFSETSNKKKKTLDERPTETFKEKNVQEQCINVFVVILLEQRTLNKRFINVTVHNFCSENVSWGEL